MHARSSHPRLVALVALAALQLGAACSKEAAALGEPFVTLPLDQALVLAAQRGKVVFVDFGATWCGPCKRLAATTLVDERVRDWLREHTVPLRLDVDEVKDLATEFHITNVPTMLFLHPDRTELGRITGFRDVDAFLAEAAQRLQGISAVDQAKAETAAAPRNASKQMALMRELTSARRYNEALAAADAYWTTSRSDLSQGGVRGSFFLSEMERLAAKYPPASARMRQWLDDARQRLEGRKPDLMDAMDFASLARQLGKTDAVVETAAALEKSGSEGHATAGMLATVASAELVAARHYALVANSGTCSPEMVEQQLELMNSALPRVPGMTDEMRAEMKQTMRKSAIERAMPAFEALAGVGRIDDAKAVAAAILRTDKSAEVLEQLATAARRAGNEELARQYGTGR